MSAVILVPLAGVLSTVAATAVLWFIKPGIIVRLAMKYMLRKTGAVVKHVTIGERTYCYAERGTQSTDHLSMVLVHGFSASKDMWVPLLKKLPPTIHVIVLDLLGHGGTTVPQPGEDISLEAFVQGMNEVLRAAGCDRPFHLVGTSMGGIVSSLYAATYPRHVAKLTLICPAIVTPEDTEFMREARSGKCRLLPTDVAGLEYMLNSCIYRETRINRQVLLGILQLRLPKTQFYTALFAEILGVEQDPVRLQRLEDKAHSVRMPVQVVWGKHDQIIHPSGAERLRSLLPDCRRVDLLDECGHSVNMDRPGLVCKVLLQFRGELSNDS